MQIVTEKLTMAVFSVKDAPGGLLPKAAVVNSIRKIAMQGRESVAVEAATARTQPVSPQDLGSSNVELRPEIWFLRPINMILRMQLFVLLL